MHYFLGKLLDPTSLLVCWSCTQRGVNFLSHDYRISVQTYWTVCGRSTATSCVTSANLITCCRERDGGRRESVMAKYTILTVEWVIKK